MTIYRLRSGHSSVDPTLADGEVGFDSATGAVKVGDGATAWSDLPTVTENLTDPTDAQDAATKNYVDGQGFVVGDGITDVVALTQAEYDALGTPDASTLYVVTD